MKPSNMWIDEKDEWLNRDLPMEFFLPPDHGGLPWSSDIIKTFKEIPDEHRKMATFLIHLVQRHVKAASYYEWPDGFWSRLREFLHWPVPPTYVSPETSCLKARCLIYLVYLNYIDRHGELLPLPCGWWTDAVMIDPEWIVRITNGIIRWMGDESCDLCGRDDCIFSKERD